MYLNTDFIKQLLAGVLSFLYNVYPTTNYTSLISSYELMSSLFPDGS